MSFIFGSETSGQKKAGKYINRAANTLTDARSDLLQNPNFLALQNLGSMIGSNPLTLDPQTVALIKANANQSAQSQAGGTLASLWERAGASGGYRNGATRGAEERVAIGLGDTFANNSRQTDIAAATQRNTDIINAINAMLPVIQTRYGFDRDLANVWSGASTNPIWAQPSPTSQALGGLGSLFGLIGTAPQTGGGTLLGNLFS